MNKNSRKQYRVWERIVKGFANHRRIEILTLLKKEPELSVTDVSEKLNINFKTASEHIRRLALADLIIKRYEGNNVRHKITNRAQSILKFLRILE